MDSTPWARTALPIRRIEEHPIARANREVWPHTVPAVRQVLDNGLDLAPLTILVGENGSGKSTLVEAIAEAFGLNPEGGTQNARYATQRTESVLHEHLQLIRDGGASKKGVFLRAETMHSLFAYLSEFNEGLHNQQSHGESFIEFFTNRAGIRGLWLFDEAESALSFHGCLALIVHVNTLLSTGSQVVIATHSPILASIPGAQIYELGDWGLRSTTYDELAMVQHWRLFLDAPERYLRHVG